MTPALALRARRLTALRYRRLMADGYRRLPAKAHGRLDGIASELEGLAEALAAPGPVAVKGAAQAWLLLTDGTGPLYNSRSATALRACAAPAAESLDVD